MPMAHGTKFRQAVFDLARRAESRPLTALARWTATR